ncbi:MAG: SulP family inorganic anion transporter [Alcanivorax sp.]|nr:SulP family inorganic anion transporter [Alcanivorax sp.]
MLRTIQQEWFSNIRADVLAGMVVAMALIPEAIAFSIIAGVDPKVGLYASFCIAVVSAFAGGRPAMISAATAAMALVMTSLVREHGLQYLLATTVLTGVFQIIAGFMRLDRLMRFVSRSVVTGFVNALAVSIFLAQLPQLTHVTWHVYALTAGGLAMIYLLPRLTTAVPSPLISIVVITAISMFWGLPVPTVGDMGQLPDSLPVFLLPDVPLNLHTLQIITPYALAMAVVGLLESMMTSTIVDELTDTSSNRNRECKSQGLANIITGFLGGMAGCAMIGQSVINVKSGGRKRLSTFVAGTFLLILVVFLDEWVSRIPMAALVAVMIMVSIGTFSWESIINVTRHPASSTVVMLATVAGTLATHNLAVGVGTGVILSALFYANKVGRVFYVRSEEGGELGQRHYQVVGQVFFTSAEQFLQSFDFKEALDKVTIDLHRAHFWDITAIGALDKVVIKFRREGTEVVLEGLNEASATLVDKFGVHDKPEAVEKMMGGH